MWGRSGVNIEWADRQKCDRARQGGYAGCGMDGKWPLEVTVYGKHRCRRELFGSVMSKELFDLVVIGAGPAGLAAAIEAKKSGLNGLVLEKGGITNSILHFPVQMVF